jgi:hypothetical protein
VTPITCRFQASWVLLLMLANSGWSVRRLQPLLTNGTNHPVGLIKIESQVDRGDFVLNTQFCISSTLVSPSPHSGRTTV